MDLKTDTQRGLSDEAKVTITAPIILRQRFEAARDAVFAIEKLFPVEHPTRGEFFKVRDLLCATYDNAIQAQGWTTYNTYMGVTPITKPSN